MEQPELTYEDYCSITEWLTDYRDIRNYLLANYIPEWRRFLAGCFRQLVHRDTQIKIPYSSFRYFTRVRNLVNIVIEVSNLNQLEALLRHRHLEQVIVIYDPDQLVMTTEQLIDLLMVVHNGLISWIDQPNRYLLLDLRVSYPGLDRWLIDVGSGYFGLDLVTTGFRLDLDDLVQAVDRVHPIQILNLHGTDPNLLLSSIEQLESLTTIATQRLTVPLLQQMNLRGIRELYHSDFLMMNPLISPVPMIDRSEQNILRTLNNGSYDLETWQTDLELVRPNLRVLDAPFEPLEVFELLDWMPGLEQVTVYLPAVETPSVQRAFWELDFYLRTRYPDVKVLLITTAQDLDDLKAMLKELDERTPGRYRLHPMIESLAPTTTAETMNP